MSFPNSADESQLPVFLHDATSENMELALDWLKRQRSSRPSASLSEFLSGLDCVNTEVLVDLACVDLINRRRSGQQVTAADYIADLPQIPPEDHLDLIDSEICVDRELECLAPLHVYKQRYAKFVDEVAELYAMEIDSSGLLIEQETDQAKRKPPEISGSWDESGRSLEFSIVSPSPETSPQSSKPTDLEIPIEVPGWFSGTQCVASGQGHWLLRGRDSSRGETLAMKIIRLPSQVTLAQIDGLLEACEKAAKVSNASWVPPAVAAVQQKHLAIVRPWIFGSAWDDIAEPVSVGQKVRQLASLAYALQAAHRIGAAHGSIRRSNLLYDHDASTRLIDCVSSRIGILRWLRISPGSSLCSWVDRQLLDVQDLLGLIADDSIGWSRVWADKLVPDLRGAADLHRDEACGVIGDRLMEWSERDEMTMPISKRNSWRSRIARWISPD